MPSRATDLRQNLVTVEGHRHATIHRRCWFVMLRMTADGQPFWLKDAQDFKPSKSFRFVFVLFVLSFTQGFVPCPRLGAHFGASKKQTAQN